MARPPTFLNRRGARWRGKSNDGNRHVRRSLRSHPEARLHSGNSGTDPRGSRRPTRARAIFPLLPAGLCFLAGLSVRLRRVSDGAPPDRRILGLADSATIGSRYAHSAVAYSFSSSPSLG